MPAQLVSIGLRPAAAALTQGRRVDGWARRTLADAATSSALAGLDALLASRFLEQALERTLNSPAAERAVDAALRGPLVDALARALDTPAMERLVGRVVDSRLMGDAVARLLESEALWTLVDEVARSPAVAAAITQQGAGFADQIAGEVRERSQHGDAWLERTARRLTRRRAAGPPPGAAGEPGPA